MVGVNGQVFMGLFCLHVTMAATRSSKASAKLALDFPRQFLRSAPSLRPKIWVVEAADLTISSVHRAAVGIVDARCFTSVSTPFSYHDDKLPEQATSSEQIADMFFAQKNNHRGNQDDEEDD
ncbi:DNA ligase 1-like protein [Drosera capensis]